MKIRNLSITILTISFSLLISLSAMQAVSEGEAYLPFAEEMPSPVGGLAGIYKNVKYPEIAQKAGIQGKVYLLAFVNENGIVEDVKVIKGIGGGCDEAAAAAVKKTKFSPGKNKGKPVKVKFSLAIKFKLN